MTKAWQIYYNAAFGALGALLAWLVVGQVHSAAWNIHLANLFAGAGIGLLIGGSLGIVEGLLVRRSPLWSAVGLVGGALVGMISGMLGLLLGGWVFVAIQGGLMARVLGWLVFGAFLGAGLGVVRLSLRRALYGLIGGSIGGLLAGLLYELFTQILLQWSDRAQIFLSAIAVALIGILLGVMIPLSVTVISGWRSERGLIVYLNGPRQGTEIELVGAAAIGSSDACEVYVPDRRVEKRQAEIQPGPQGFAVRNVGGVQPFRVDQALVTPGRELALPDGAFLQFGEIALRFQVG